MRRRDRGKGAPPADLLVCFPSRAHLSLMPKPICSPARPPEHPAATATTRHRRRHSHHFHHPMRSSSTRGRGEDISEPTSPKVTCAGQIKVRPKSSSCKNWQSVMEEIERLQKQRKQRKQRKRSAWSEAIRLKKDVVQFLTCIRNIRLDFRCFGNFPAADVTSGDEEEEDDDDENEDIMEEQGSNNYKKSKWFMILQEDKEFVTHDEAKGKNIKPCLADEDERDVDAHCVPPPNALVLMRCRSAPAKSWMEEQEEEDEEEEEEEEKEKGKNGNKNDEQKGSDQKANVDETQSVLLMRYGEMSITDTVEETWVVGGITDMFSRSRSWKK